ncbi:nucleotide disphospho-sugar-binding domain-containing protein [Actinoplanes sp. NPDC049548]|uniref:nucleotide disphospho-sugar-binding domain-containing protein n=1 Tax=Actinoplanes sp. NPDC049548 TaxID=3155152 RepID=UPI00343E7FA0
MRFLFTTSNWRGNYFCMVPLGWALQAAGHQVRVACPPEQADAIAHAGLVPVPVLEGLDVMRLERMARYSEALAGEHPLLPLHPVTGRPVSRLDEFDPEAAWPPFWEQTLASMRRSCDNAVGFAREYRPDLVVWDLMSEEGALAAAVTGVPAVFHPPGMYGTVEIVDGEDMSPGDPSGSFPRHGLGRWGRGDIGYVLDPSPPSVHPPVGDALRLPVRYVPYNGPGAMPDWVLDRPRRPRVSLIWGNAATAMYGTQVPALRYAIDAALAAGAEVVLTAGAAQVEALGTLPDRVRVLRDFPIHLLLPTSDVIIHQGSANGLMPAAAAGVPQLSLALSVDQVLPSERLARTGAVVTLRGLTAGPAEIRSAVEALLTDPRYAAAADRVRAEMAAQPSPAQLVATLERLAGHLIPV